MVAGYSATARHLWRTSPWWRGSVIGAAGFTALFAVYVFVGPARRVVSPYSTPFAAPPPPPPVKPDPAAEARLAEYDKAYGTYNSETRPGIRCEQLGAAFDTLDPSDVSAGRSVLFSTAARIRSLAEGQTCHDSLVVSDARLNALEAAVSKSDRDGLANPCPIVIPAYSALTAFDRTRSSFKPDSSTLVEANSISEKCHASDDRLKGLSAAVTQLKVGGRPEDYVRAAGTLQQITDFDSGRASADQKSIISQAQKAADQVSDSKARIARLPGLLSAAGNNDQEATMSLFSATTGISSFDLAIASAEDKSIVEQARKKVLLLSWEFLRTRLGTLAKDHSPSNYQAVVDVYRIVLLDQNTLTDEQKHLRDEGRDASQFLAESNARLQRILTAAKDWNDYGLARKSEVRAALDSLSKFDMDRLDMDDVHQQAFDVLKHADAIIRGPELGLKNSGTTSTSIYVFPSSNDENDTKVARSLSYTLSKAGYLITQVRQKAALLLEVSVLPLGASGFVTEGSMAYSTLDAKVHITARWAENDMVLVDDTVTGTGQGAITDVELLALRDAVAKAKAEIERLTTR